MAAKFRFRASRAWGHPSARRQLEAAWLYVLAGECAEPAYPVQAAKLMHFAAHQFRMAGSYGMAKTYYLESVRLAGESNDPTLQARSVRRAIAVAREAGADGEAVQLADEYASLLANQSDRPRGDGATPPH
jgi:hypothetical protein